MFTLPSLRKSNSGTVHNREVGNLRAVERLLGDLVREVVGRVEEGDGAENDGNGSV